MPPKKKAANGYKHAEPLKQGEILEDLGKKKWKLGVSIGRGGFGEIYSAQDANAKDTNYRYVIKLEPHSNGPLFVEMHFYMRNAKPADLEAFKQEKGLKSLGMPVYHGSGSHEYKSDKYRFLVIDKFGTDLWEIFKENNKIFPAHTVFKLGVQLLDVLEYIHSRGYVHADLKASNVLMGATKETQNKQVFLLDFGLATKFNLEKEFKPNPKKAHDGTIEYLSRDAHLGVQTRRGDLEILVYNLIQWLGCKLPWEDNLTDPKIVQNSKEENMKDIQNFLKTCFDTKKPPKAIVEFLKYIKSLKFNSEPDYNKIRNIFISGIKDAGGSLDAPFEFSASNDSPVKRKNGQKTSPTLKKARKNDVIAEEPKPIKKRGRSKKKEDDDVVVDDDDDEEDVKEKPINFKGTSSRPRRVQNAPIVESDDENEKVKKPRKRTAKTKEPEPVENGYVDPYAGFTDAMKEIAMKKTQKGKKTVRGRRKAIPE